MRLVRSIFFLLTFLSIAHAQSNETHILLLNSYHHGYVFSDNIFRGVRNTFSDEDILLSVEYLDSKRHSLSDYETLFIELLKRKNKHLKYDLIICSDDNAFNLLKQYRNDIYGEETPVVFCGVNFLKPAKLEGFKNVTGINEEADIQTNCDLIRKIHPSRNKLLILTDTTTSGQAFQKEVARLKPSLNNQFKMVELDTGLSMQELQNKLQQLDDSWVVLYSSFSKDTNGTFFEFKTSADMVVEASPVPVYCLWQFSIGAGMIGGKVVDGYLQGTTAAKMALSILDGTPANEIPVLYKTPLHYIFNNEALTRFGVSKKLLPENCKIIKNPPSFYSTYKSYFWGAVIGLPLLTGIIIILSHHLRRSKCAEAALRHSQENLLRARLYITSVIDSSPSWLIGIDDKMIITQLNKTALQESGILRAKAKGFSVLEVFPKLQPYADELLQAIQTKKTIRKPKIALSLHKKMRFAGLTLYPLSTKDSHGAVICIDDVTQQVQMEQSLEQQSKMQAIGQLAGGVAHDFNNLLCAIFNLVEHMEGHVDSEGQRNLSMINDSAKRAADLTAQLLTFSRKGKIEHMPVSIHLSINDTVSLLKRTLSKNINIHADLNANAFTVIGDDAQLHSALLNLGVNAGHAMPEGGDLIYRTQTTQLNKQACDISPFKLTPGDYLKIEVQDTGSGIPADLLPHIFEPFVTTRDASTGTGLGLAAVYRTIEEHHGQITVQSLPGQGTVFLIHLPLQSQDIDAPKHEAAQTKNGTILLVDDEELIRESSEIILQRLGYNVRLAPNGLKAIETYKAHKADIDLVIMDLVMPGLSGAQALEQLIAIDPNIKVLIASGFSECDVSDSLQGHTGFIRKPYTSAELSQKMSHYLQK